MDTPRIYVASLMDYNAGILHGRWIDADEGEDHIWSEIREMLAESPEAATEFSRKWGMVAEEWAIHDYEGFAPLSLSEYESISKIAAIAETAAELGHLAPAFFGWLDNDSSREPDKDAFYEEYEGEYDSFADYAYHVAEEFGYDKEADDHLLAAGGSSHGS